MFVRIAQIAFANTVVFGLKEKDYQMPVNNSKNES
jgi:hypothetical protein